MQIAAIGIGRNCSLPTPHVRYERSYLGCPQKDVFTYKQ